MFQAILVIHLLICLGIIGLVLLQQGKGAEAGAIFGSSSDSVIGAGNAPNFIGRLTTSLAIAFMFTSILLVKVYMTRTAEGPQPSSKVMDGSVFDTAVHEGEDTTPEAPVAKVAVEQPAVAVDAPQTEPAPEQAVAPKVEAAKEVAAEEPSAKN